jgi:Arc/MetJ-type ribon-helix-helix transcriptional regulator
MDHTTVNTVVNEVRMGSSETDVAIEATEPARHGFSIEGRWEQIQARAGILSGQRVRVTVLDDAEPSLNSDDAEPARNMGMLEAISAITRIVQELQPTSDKANYLKEAREGMSTTKVALSLDSKLLEQLDRLVAERDFANRSQAVQDAMREKLDGLAHTRLARECAKLDATAEQALGDQVLAKDTTEWSEY